MFNVDELIWIDFESASALDLKAVGTVRYAADASTRAIVLAYAIGNAPALTWHADGAILDWNDAPEDLRDAFTSRRDHRRVERQLRQRDLELRDARISFPGAGARHRCDDPGRRLQSADRSRKRLARTSAARASRRTARSSSGCSASRARRPRAHPAEWQQFLAYARQDVEAMRDVYRRTRPLPHEEWQQYWAFEHVNRRGVAIDVPFVHPRCCTRGRGCRRHRPAAGRANRRGCHPGHAGETARGLAARSAHRRCDARGADGWRSRR